MLGSYAQIPSSRLINGGNMVESVPTYVLHSSVSQTSISGRKKNVNELLLFSEKCCQASRSSPLNEITRPVSWLFFLPRNTLNCPKSVAFVCKQNKKFEVHLHHDTFLLLRIMRKLTPANNEKAYDFSPVWRTAFISPVANCEQTATALKSSDEQSMGMPS